MQPGDASTNLNTLRAGIYLGSERHKTVGQRAYGGYWTA